MTSSVACKSAKPRLHVAPPAVDTFGDLACDLAADYGLNLDDWQRAIIDDWLGVGADGLWASLTCGCSVARQNGKNAVLEVRELFGMVGRGERILHTAHEVKTARKAFKRLQQFFGRQVNDPGARFPELNARVVELRNVNGQEAIFLDNGGSVEIVARSKNSGRGFTADVLVCDEAQEMSDEDLEALMPTTSAAPLGNPQWIFTGTPPGPKVNGEVFTRTRNDALGERPYRICWHEWSACDPGGLGTVDLDDRQVWADNNPALEVGRLLISVVEGERSRYSDEGFARERLGVWDDPEVRDARIIPEALWRACADKTAKPTGELAYSIDASPDLRSAAISVSDGRMVAVLEHHPGVAWLPGKLAEILAEAPGAVHLDPKGPVGALLVDLEAQGTEWVEISPSEHAQACGGLLGAVLNGEGVRHPDQSVLNAAVAGATRRNYADAWVWNRRTAADDICPLVAATIARWAALQAGDSSIYEDRGLLSL